ncbi:MAG TPA: hypothetical protein PKK85_10125 [Methanobacteriaceae archaeon]|nr:hypothetical protein [Methanobacteriaceae archaeon]
MEITIKCEWCGQPLKTRDLRRKYHKVNQDGVFCSLEAQRECNRQRQQRHTKQNGYKQKTGTGLLGPHRHSDPQVEEYEILKEKRRLKLTIR